MRAYVCLVETGIGVVCSNSSHIYLTKNHTEISHQDTDQSTTIYKYLLPLKPHLWL